MVEKNIRLKTHVGNGVYDTLHPETNSEIVRVGDKNLDETLGEVTAQLAQNVTQLNKKTPDYVYNTSALKKSRKQYITTVYKGDSIGTGSGSTSGNYGFLQMFANTARSLQNGINFLTYHMPTETSGRSWDNVGGIGTALYSSNDTSLSIRVGLGQSHKKPNFAYKFNVIYSTRPDGGTCEVKYGTTVVGTINCNGTLTDGLLATFDIPANQTAEIVPSVGNKVYINGYFVEKTGSIGHKVLGFSQGGSKASDYSKETLESAIKVLPNDLLIWEFLANDWSQGAYDGFVDRTNFIVDKAKELGMDVIITITCGQEGTEGNVLWKQFRDFIYETAKVKDCCVIDYDNYFGGYTEAKSNGLITDTVHPSDKGYILMANILCQVVFGVNCLEYEGKFIVEDDIRNPAYGYVNKDILTRYTKIITEDLQLKTGNFWETQSSLSVQPIARVGTVYPSLAKVGTIATETNNNVVKVKIEDNSWITALANPLIPTITFLPTQNDKNIGKLWLYNGQVITYMPDRTYKAFSLTTVV